MTSSSKANADIAEQRPLEICKIHSSLPLPHRTAHPLRIALFFQFINVAPCIPSDGAHNQQPRLQGKPLLKMETLLTLDSSRSRTETARAQRPRSPA